MILGFLRLFQMFQGLNKIFFHDSGSVKDFHMNR